MEMQVTALVPGTILLELDPAPFSVAQAAMLHRFSARAVEAGGRQVGQARDFRACRDMLVCTADIDTIVQAGQLVMVGTFAVKGPV